jgi:A/G-specific adenine glycosylase
MSRTDAPAERDIVAQARDHGHWLADRLVAWQARNGRHHLPWQQDRTAYRVWLSEIMLQQTQVSTVLPYFDRFLQRFPDVADLAAAPLDEVLAMWSGLGYYSRARNLHRCAQAVVTSHGGAFPRSCEALQTLPGIGPSTAAAIASFCFGERVSIMDGNVKRVLSRVLGFEGDLSVRQHEKALIAAAAELLPLQGADMPAYTQGLMDLGATVCMPRKASCLVCPWSEGCAGRAAGDPERLPIKSRKLKRSERRGSFVWLHWQDQVWLAQMPSTGVWAGLWTFPFWDDDEAAQQALEPLASTWSGWWAEGEAQPPLKHVLTHLDWWLHTRRWVLSSQDQADAMARALSAAMPDARGQWVALAELDRFGLPAPIRRALTG